MPSDVFGVHGSPDAQADSVGREMGRAMKGPQGGRVSRIGYTNRQGERIIRRWDDKGEKMEIRVKPLE